VLVEIRGLNNEKEKEQIRKKNHEKKKQKWKKDINESTD
tara:strand:- start:224 stop:340 length:117 start_codon:yes stop_codon:yes gene_type:complete